MTTVTLRTLLREPIKVKKLTRQGAKVQVTDDGEPLWIIESAKKAKVKKEVLDEVNSMLDEVLKEPEANVGLAKIIKDSRR